MTRRFFKRAAWTCAVPAILCASLLAWSLASPSWISRGRVSVGITRGQIKVGWGNGKIIRQPNAWAVQNPQGFASILLGPRSMWRPSMSGASMGAGPTGAPASLFKLSALYIPLWPWAVLLGGGATLLWWRARRVPIPGHCRKCGYDLAGLSDEKCPECGTPLIGLVTRMIRIRLQRWRDRTYRFGSLCSTPVRSANRTC